jgi:transcription initiation factor TFIID subunit 12
MSQEEMQEFKNRQLAAEKLFREGTEFLNKLEVRLGLGSY